MGTAIFADVGYLSERDLNYGLPVNCYVCGTAHKAFGLVRIKDDRSTIVVPLCEACCAPDKMDAIVRIFLNAPDLEIRKGGEATTEQLLAMAEKPDEKEN